MSQVNQLNFTHLQYMTPLLVQDDKSSFVHLVLSNVEGLNTNLLNPDHGVAAEYHAQNGDIYSVTKLPFGFLMEVPNRVPDEGEYFSEAEHINTLLDLVNEEVGLVQGHLDVDVFDKLVPWNKVALASVAHMDDEDEGEDGGALPTAHVWVCPLTYADPQGVHLQNNDVTQLHPITRPEVEGAPSTKVPQGYIIRLFDGEDPEKYIEREFPQLVRTEVSTGDGVQYVYMDESINPAILEIN